MGTTGTVLVDRAVTKFTISKKQTGNSKPAAQRHPLTHRRDSMTGRSFANFIAGIRKGESSTRYLRKATRRHHAHLSNIAWEVNRELHLDPTNGRVQSDPEANEDGGLANTKRTGRPF